MFENEVEKKDLQIVDRKKEIKHTANKMALGVFLYSLIMFVVVIGDLIVKCIRICLDYSNEKDLNRQINALLDHSMQSGVSTIISIAIGIAFLLFFFKKYKFEKSIFHTERKMNCKSFLTLFIIFMSAQALFSIIGMGMENILNHFGYSLMDEIEMATGGSESISMFLYASFLGPITEELVFRGFLMRGFQRYGRIFAIIVSAVVFGAFHGNIIQGIFATFVGFVLGYIAMEYSIKWSMLMHIINNFVFSELWSLFVSHFNETIQTVLSYSLEGVFFIGALVIVYYNRKKIKDFIKNRKINKKLYLYTFTSGWMIVFLAIQLFLGIFGIQRL